MCGTGIRVSVSRWLFFIFASACGVPVLIPISDGFGAVYGKMTQLFKSANKLGPLTPQK
jgi:hypothetical protein